MPVSRALVAKLIIAIGCMIMWLVHWINYGLTDFWFLTGGVIVALGLGLLPDWSSRSKG